MLTQDPANEITSTIIGAAIEVHRHLGPGLLESAYQQCLLYEMQRKGLKFNTQVKVPVKYREVALDCGYKLDLIVEEKVIVELKAIEQIHGFTRRSY